MLSDASITLLQHAPQITADTLGIWVPTASHLSGHVTATCQFVTNDEAISFHELTFSWNGSEKAVQPYIKQGLSKPAAWEDFHSISLIGFKAKSQRR